MPQLKNPIATFWVIFKHCGASANHIPELKKVRSSPNFFKVEFTLSLHRKYDGSRQKQEREGSSNLYHASFASESHRETGNV